ncbi:hypothetical protein RJT34_13161 [Clitoria ternatea]|uniref:Uncharacterized protein n=1 Tax=Clitoria ternatea TaxID=43366 RepID=A0AAN9JQ37_CLITE
MARGLTKRRCTHGRLPLVIEGLPIEVDSQAMKSFLPDMDVEVIESMSQRNDESPHSCSSTTFQKVVDDERREVCSGQNSNSRAALLPLRSPPSETQNENNTELV